MTRKKERELIERLQKGDEIAREKLILEAMKFVKYIAKDYFKPGSSFEFDDLIQEGSIGLIKAVDAVAKGKKLKNRFISYANKVMRNEIRQAVTQKGNMIRHSSHWFLQKKLERLAMALTHSWDNLNGEFNNFQYISPINRLSLHHDLIDTMKEFLTFEEEDIIKLKFGFGHVYFDTPDWQNPNKPLTREKIAKILSCSIKRVKVREEKAMDKLRTDEVKARLIEWL